MDILLVSVIYGGIALLVGFYTFFRGILARPMPHIFTTEDRVVVGLASGVIGLLWLLFTPVMVVRWAMQLFRWLDEKRARLSVWMLGEARLRS